jgi:murein DD-endopeptidase MepM/ murein hydrolase activator NlpD
MSKDFYTFLIIPKKKNSVKKVTISGTLMKGISVSLLCLLLLAVYTHYDYINIKREKVELSRLRQQAKEQRTQIEALAEKVNNYAATMDEFKQLDKQVRVLANVYDKTDKGQIPGIGGSISSDRRVASRMEDDQKTLIASIDKNMDRLTEDANNQRQSYSNLLKFLKERKSIREATPSIWPVRGWVTSEFGNRTSPFGTSQEFHKGLDIASRMGNQVLAPADGMVVESTYDCEMGHMVRIDHGYSMVTWYGHLMKAAVKEGSLIKRGDVIGYIGNSGRSTGPHLHYSVFLSGVPVNPRKYLN